MITLLAVLLIVNGVWNVVVWPQFLKRVAKDPRARNADGSRTPFFTVHLVLVSVSLLLALVSIVAAVAAFLS
ncbi:SCO4848 family membrane protein [Clavibacter sepedonicus]|uniref:Integral membrane protein n=1 Tax=Clavibacter sepedonicus TaxID=31964 RepID=B0RBA6_CLASE|nr:MULTISPECIES: hypothetical protein [Clavibacter]MBD5381005.1 hypothetical protein [Clavibacter sp.]OQJ47337.1 hypothetical protein B5P19_02855 [Clavibacter sepedonicus]OQJ52893.1 hypothetical protein B5P20_01115 [Clavibacter sepedonicus]UUK66891.1 hypothetical protein LRE50_06725 [Clavibacter sepedonicus]CAQ01647.1 putative integral membrane protein [Clavibacter sepedonicus]